MADKLRVHNLSKELGVSSKAILDKCKKENIEGITNHMSTVSAGLAETVREWFSEGVHKTAVETAAPVDLKKVRVRRKKKVVEPAKTESPGEEATAVAVEEQKESAASPTTEGTESPSTADAAVATASGEPDAGVSVVHSPETIADLEPATASPETETLPTPAEPLAPAAEAPPAVAAQAPEPPAPVKPAGPQNVPMPVQMRGPRVVGFAKPDPVRAPVPRGPGRGPAPGADSDAVDAAGRRGPRGKTTAAEEAAKRSRARVHPRRSGRSLQETGERLREWNDRDLLERQERLQAASGHGIMAHRAKERSNMRMPAQIAPRKTKAQVREPIVAHELCAATGIGLSQIWPRFKNEHNLLLNRNSIVPTELAQVMMLDFGVELEVVKPKTELEKVAEEFAQHERNNMQPRPPIVTMLGHVDHGKTSLLDAIRRTQVAAGEAGGITQHIGAYQVERGNLKVTFLDTPGHEAFTSMRARGANMTDVVVLVVAADDGLMPQTIEAINHAKAAKVAIVVALNKIDLPGVDANKIYGQLAEQGLVPTEWGGDVDVIKTSATMGQGVEDLIAHLTTLTDLLELRADPTVPAQGVVIEAQMQTGMGPLARVLIQEGTLSTGDFVVCGPGAGRVRSLKDDRGRVIAQAVPGMPVEMAGLDEVPNAGERFYVLKSLQYAKQVAEEVKHARRSESLVRVNKVVSLEDLFQQRESGKRPELNLILRSDVSGSVDAILKSLGEIPDEEVKLNILHTGIGSVSESDVVLAEASKAMIAGFNVTADGGAQKLADSTGVDIRLYRVIYDVVNDIRAALEGLLAPNQAEELRGKAEVREIFHVSRVGTIAGCFVTEGTIVRSHNVRVVRDGQIIVPTAEDVKHKRHRPIGSLKRFKDDAREVRHGMECGIRVDGFDDVKPGDILEAYEVVETARKL